MWYTMCDKNMGKRPRELLYGSQGRGSSLRTHFRLLPGGSTPLSSRPLPGELRLDFELQKIRLLSALLSWGAGSAVPPGAEAGEAELELAAALAEWPDQVLPL